MKLFSDMVSPTGDIDSDLWDYRAAHDIAVGKCRCGSLLGARPAERPAYSTVTYRDLYCANGHESSITSGYTGATIPVGREQVDISEARHERTFRVIEGDKK